MKILAIGVAFVAAVYGRKEKCYTLNFAGGGSKGAFEAGALHTLVHDLPADERQYDVIAGVSVGAINAGFASVYEKGDELRLANDLIYFW